MKDKHRIAADIARTLAGVAGTAVLTYLLSPSAFDHLAGLAGDRWLWAIPVISAALRALEAYFQHLVDSDPFKDVN